MNKRKHKHKLSRGNKGVIKIGQFIIEVKNWNLDIMTDMINDSTIDNKDNFVEGLCSAKGSFTVDTDSYGILSPSTNMSVTLYPDRSNKIANCDAFISIHHATIDKIAIWFEVSSPVTWSTI